MNKYYTLVTPGLCGDWGDVILVDSRVADLLRKVTMYHENIEDITSFFTSKDWKFLKKELNCVKLNDQDFINHVEFNWDSSMTENYYDLAKLKSTIEFGGMAGVIKYVTEHKLEIVGDLY